jgi:protease stability complex PrcB-like protein
MRLSVLALSVAALAACGVPPSSPDRIDQPLTFARLRSEQSSLTYTSGLQLPTQFVIRDDSGWQQAWTEIWRGQTPVPALPAIDFDRDMVIVVALGEKPTGGYSIFIDSVTETTTGLTVQLRTVSPGATCAVTLAVSQPVDVARVSQRAGPITYSQRAETQDCR